MDKKKIEGMMEARQALKMGLSNEAILGMLAQRGFAPAIALLILNAVREP